MYIYSPRARGVSPWGQLFMKAEMSYHFDHWLHVSKNIFALWFYAHFFMTFMYIASAGTEITHLGQKFDVNRKASSLQPLILYISFHDLIHVYSPGAGADNPHGTKFWCQQKHLVTSVICYKFQKNLFEGWFCIHFFVILHTYIAPGHGEDTSWCKQKGLSCCPFVASFKTIL